MVIVSEGRQRLIDYRFVTWLHGLTLPSDIFPSQYIRLAAFSAAL